jgi:glutathionylspermidine synthase
MQRISTTPRQDWQRKVEELGFNFHSVDGYWNENAYYRFNMDQINIIEKATNDLFELNLEAVQYVIDNNLFHKFHIPQKFVPMIIDSWERELPSIYARFDFAYDGVNAPKMLEFNADTPTSLYEAAVVQWKWLEEKMPYADQFNSLHEALVAHWREIKPYMNGGKLHLGCVADNIEDFTTVSYIQDVASQAGINVENGLLYMHEIGFNHITNNFVDAANMPIYDIFKLYPWEWMVHEEFADSIIQNASKTNWIEPVWKMILSNKAILPILWEIAPNHPNLLPTYFDAPNGLVNYAKKPLLSREGANIELYKNNQLIAGTSGEYGEEGYIYQQLVDLPKFDNNHAIIGSWVIGGKSVGMGIRESSSLITDNLSKFVPHVIEYV